MKKRLFIPVFLLALGLDQLTKFLAVKYLFGKSIPILGKYAALTFATNTGGAFGILPHFPVLFTWTGLLLLVLMVIFLKRILALSPAYQVSLGMVAGGALGNIVDRLRMGKVIDFIDFKIWPIFNLADSFITVGVLILMVLFLLEHKEERKGAS